MRNKILKGITGAAVVGIMVAGSCLDSENYMPFMAVCMICFTWCTLFYFANKDRFESER